MIIKTSDVLSLLKAGKTRKEIAEFYGISMSDCKRLFMHPVLKGKKTIKQFDKFVIEDDTVEDTVEEKDESQISFAFSETEQQFY